jgi:hypothetical protein
VETPTPEPSAITETLGGLLGDSNGDTSGDTTSGNSEVSASPTPTDDTGGSSLQSLVQAVSRFVGGPADAVFGQFV